MNIQLGKLTTQLVSYDQNSDEDQARASELGLSVERPVFRAFEVSVYNIHVLRALKNNEDHPVYNERWCSTQRSIVLARDEVELAKKMSVQFPASCGFIVEDIAERPNGSVL